MEGERDRDLIVVGVDETEAAGAAIEFALREGAARGMTVEAVAAWIWTSPYEEFDADSFERNRAAAAEILEAQVQKALSNVSSSEVPGRPSVVRTVMHDYAGRALTARAEDAAMLVVGSARKGIVRRTLQGSVSDYCVRHSPVPVVVVPQPDRGDHPAGDVVAGSLQSSQA